MTSTTETTAGIKDELFAGRRWLTMKEAGQVLGISGEAVRALIRRGRLPYTTLGAKIYIDRLALDSMLEARKVTLSD
jgi:excisionase family DNA binding protein